MRKTTLVVDDHRLAQAAAALGTKGMKATIDKALDEVIARAAREQAIEQLIALAPTLGDKDLMQSAWR